MFNPKLLIMTNDVGVIAVECARLSRVAGLLVQSVAQDCLEHPDKHRLWAGYDLEDGGRVYLEYRRGCKDCVDGGVCDGYC